MSLCGATTNRGGTCKQVALANGRCHYHGGKSLAGIVSPRYKHGRYSKSIPARLAGNYEEAIKDPRILELNQDIALVDTRLGELLEKIDTGETKDTWTSIRETYASLRAAMNRQDKPGISTNLVHLDGLIAQGGADYEVWEEIGKALEQRRRLVESENKRRKDMQEFITSQQALTLMGAIVGIIKTHVTDHTQLYAISRAIDALALTESGG